MKKILIAFSLFSISFFAQAQDNLYLNLKKIITETHPEINLQNKLIAFNVWSIDNAESREANKSFEKVYDVYGLARLKGGTRGIVVISISKDELISEAVIAFTKDGLSKLISVKLSDLAGLDGNTFNEVYDSEGHMIYKNLSAQTVYASINHLITR